jgi:hypothetical protein
LFRKLKVGDYVLIEDLTLDDTYKSEIKKKGPKYFYINRYGQELKFYIETGEQYYKKDINLNSFIVNERKAYLL